MTRLAVGYLIYLLLSVGITVFVGQTLHRHGRLFLIDVFHGNVHLADTVNHLLLVGFYLTNIAFVLLMLRSPSTPADRLAVATLLSDKFGIVLTTLGAMHFFNVAVLLAVRRHVWRTPMKVVTFLD